MNRRGRWIWIPIIILILAHQDFWLWDNRDIVLGFLPSGLAYHVVLSVLAAITWVFAVKYAWPEDLEKWASENDEPPSGSEN